MFGMGTGGTPRSMVTGNLRRFESLRRLAPGGFNRNPEALAHGFSFRLFNLRRRLAGSPAAFSPFASTLDGWFDPQRYRTVKRQTGAIQT